MQISPKAILPFIPVAIGATTCAYSLINCLHTYTRTQELKERFSKASDVEKGPLVDTSCDIHEINYTPFQEVSTWLIAAAILGIFTHTRVSSVKACAISVCAATIIKCLKSPLKRQQDLITTNCNVTKSHSEKYYQSAYESSTFYESSISLTVAVNQSCGDDIKTRMFDLFKTCVLSNPKTPADIEKIIKSQPNATSYNWTVENDTIVVRLR